MCIKEYLNSNIILSGPSHSCQLSRNLRDSPGFFRLLSRKGTEEPYYNANCHGISLIGDYAYAAPRHSKRHWYIQASSPGRYI